MRVLSGCLIVLLSLAYAPAAGAQDADFTYVRVVPLAPVAYGHVVFADANHDHDLDLFVSGYSDAPVTYVAEGLRDELYSAGMNISYWRRIFSPPRRLPSSWKGSASLADLDNDGQVDFLLSGATAPLKPVDARIRFYSSDGQPLFSMKGYINTAQQVLDFDNDGDEDLLLAGLADDGSHATRLLTQDSGTWHSEQTALPDLAYGTAAACDFDGDTDVDLFLGGLEQNAARTGGIYENEDGAFVLRAAGLPALVYGSAACGDYDADGDPDLLLTGGRLDPLHVLRGVSHLYRNDGGTFTRVDASLPGIMEGTAAWGDADNDGDLDIFFMGNRNRESAGIAEVYLNDSGTFSFSPITMAPGRIPSSMDWGDYDADGDLDAVLSGQFNGMLSLRILRNEATTINNAPSAPMGLVHTVVGNTTTLRWQPAVDDHTPSQALTYNLRVGRSPGGTDVVSPLADPQTGQRWVSGRGNTGLGTTHTLRGLPSGTYYWSVQALDTSFKGSPFADEGTFVVP